MLEKRCRDEIVRHHFPVGFNMEPEEDDGNNVIHIAGQLIEKMEVKIFPGVEWFLPSFAFSECRLQMIFVVNHFRMIGHARDVKPSFFGQIYCISISIHYLPTYISLWSGHRLFKIILRRTSND
jgi:hypothetical protein